jgi:hypothetical protein
MTDHELDAKTLHDVVLWEKQELNYEQTLAMITKLMTTNNLWMLKDEAGKLACVELMKEEIENEH